MLSSQNEIPFSTAQIKHWTMLPKNPWISESNTGSGCLYLQYSPLAPTNGHYT